MATEPERRNRGRGCSPFRTGVQELLGKWRHIIYGELRDLGSYCRMLAKARQAQRLGANLDAVSLEKMKALLSGC
ncbi:DUF6247 family protein [Saccharothrix saharensis]|uniref:DUF6247 family protein n=1 Tax=Saccharothrix saharensis TaxID=571190 RepID=UPI0036903877